MKIFKMVRKGNFSASQHSDNQCGITGCNSFDYKIICLFSSGKFDNKGFIIDHNFINKAVVKSKSNGSCEEMHLAIHKSVLSVVKQKTKTLVAYKCIIKPNDPQLIPDPQAMLSYIDCENPQLLPLLSAD